MEEIHWMKNREGKRKMKRKWTWKKERRRNTLDDE